MNILLKLFRIRKSFNLNRNFTIIFQGLKKVHIIIYWYIYFIIVYLSSISNTLYLLFLLSSLILLISLLSLSLTLSNNFILLIFSILSDRHVLPFKPLLEKVKK